MSNDREAFQLFQLRPSSFLVKCKQISVIFRWLRCRKLATGQFRHRRARHYGNLSCLAVIRTLLSHFFHSYLFFHSNLFHSIVALISLWFQFPFQSSVLYGGKLKRYFKSLHVNIQFNKQCLRFAYGCSGANSRASIMRFTVPSSHLWPLLMDWTSKVHALLLPFIHSSLLRQLTFHWFFLFCVCFIYFYVVVFSSVPFCSLNSCGDFHWSVERKQPNCSSSAAALLLLRGCQIPSQIPPKRWSHHVSFQTSFPIFLCDIQRNR